MPRMRSGKHSGIIECGKELFARFKFWLTHTKREQRVDTWWDACRSFCPTCGYYARCKRVLEELEELEEYNG